MVKARHWSKVKEFQGKPKEDDFKLVEEDLNDEVKDGEVLCEAVFLSIDPYMGIPGDDLMKPFGKYNTMFGEAVSKVIKSRNGQYPVGTLVTSMSGWRTHFISKDGKDLNPLLFDIGNLSPSITLGVIGMPGMTAYFGVKMGELKSGEICVVTAAAGAVGSVVVQLAKAK
ncbi:unnamed protein product, partial [Didymodactylos carnosus]